MEFLEFLSYLVAPILPAFVFFGAWSMLRDTRRAHFFRHLGSMFALGAPVPEAVESLEERWGDRFATHIRDLTQEVTSGRSLSEAMRRWFSPADVTLVSIGERTGTLASVCARLGSHSATLMVIENATLLLLFYFSFLVALLLFFSRTIFGAIAKVFSDVGGGANPGGRFAVFHGAATGVAIALVCLLYAALALLILSRLGPFLAARRFRTMGPHGVVASAASLLDRLLRSLPLLGAHLWDVSCCRIARGLGILAAARLPGRDLARFLPMLDESPGFAKRLERVRQAVESGRTLAESLQAERFPPIFVWLVQSGERSGQLSSALAMAEEHCRVRIERRLFWMQRLALPGLISLVGMGVALLGLALFGGVVDFEEMML